MYLKSRYISIHLSIVPIVPTSRYNVGTKTELFFIGTDHLSIYTNILFSFRFQIIFRGLEGKKSMYFTSLFPYFSSTLQDLSKNTHIAQILQI